MVELLFVAFAYPMKGAAAVPHVRKSKLVEERMRIYADYLVADPAALRGRWRQRFGRPGAKLHVDLGCGKGLWISRVARAVPGDVYVGIDNDRTCVSFALERVGSACADNAAVVFDEARSLRELFAPGEIDVLHVNSPTPFPRKKEALNRVTSSARLMEYRDLLAEGGALQLKTDSQPLFDFTLEQLERAGYAVDRLTRDLRAGGFAATSEDLIASAYEEKLTAKGARVLALHARPAAAPAEFFPEEPVGLAQYLPEDLDSIDYAPHGMEDTVANLRNRKRNAAARSERA